MGGQWLNQRATKNRLKDTATAEEIMEQRKMYIVQNYNCDEHYEIMLTEKEYNAVMRYYDIIDNMGISNECSPPIDKEKWKNY